MELAMRKSCRTQLTKTVNETNELLNAEYFDVSAAVVQVEKVKAARESLDKANEKAGPFIGSDNLEQECDKIVEYDEKAVVAIAKLQQRIMEMKRMTDNLPLGATAVDLIENNRINSNEAAGNGGNSRAVENERCNKEKMSVRLPKLELVKFAGNLHEWPAFWEQFNSAIHDNKCLDDTAKFSYLKSVLVGNAAISIQGLTSSNTSYSHAIQLLKDEYGNKDRIIDSYIQKLLSLSSIKMRTDIVSLRKLYNITSKITKSLETLGIEPSTYGMMVKSIILKVLPLSMRIEFNKQQAAKKPHNENHELASNVSTESKAESDDSNNTGHKLVYEDQISSLLSFIKLEVDSVEQARIVGEESNDATRYKARDKSNNNHFNRGRNEIKEDTGKFTTAGLFTSVRENCLFCKSNRHLTINCNNETLKLERKKDILKTNGRCFRCTKLNHNSRNCRTNIKCDKCNRKHATSMCDPDYARKNKNSDIENGDQKRDNQRNQDATSLFANNAIESISLQTACSQIITVDETPKTFVRLVLDGGSQLTFIRESVSRQLGLPVIGTHKLSIMSFGKSELTPARLCRRVSLKLKGLKENDILTLQAIEVPEICFDSLPAPSNNDPAIREFSAKYRLADMCPKNCNILPGISILIGADYYWKVVNGEIKKLSEYQTAVNTRLGWTIHGRTNEYGFSLNVNVANILHVQVNKIPNDDEFDLKKFWDLETIGMHGVESVTKTSTRKFVADNLSFKNNRYTVSLPWIDNNLTLDSNFNGAISRCKTLTSKLIRTGKLQEYDDAVREYFENDCAEQVPEDTKENRVYYMPHRPVYRDDRETTKIRVVFDASAHALGMPSLNDLLVPGENLVPLLLKILINFRIGTVALTADIEKAFLQIEINERDRNSLSFLWYESPIEDVEKLPKIVKFRMKRVTFGVTSSPFILAVTLTKHLTEQPRHKKRVCDIMLRSFYVDDLILAVGSVEDAYHIYTEGNRVMSEANMNLRKWTTNDATLRKIINANSNQDNDSKKSPVKKILGLSWYIETDELNVDVKPVLSADHDQTTTKRNILRAVAKVYDPMGILSPFIIRAKMLLQKIWLHKYDWDSILSEELIKIWSKWINELPKLSEYYIPRCIMRNLEGKVELHIFSDASMLAYGAVAYLRTTEIDGIISCNILMAKNRVAPINEKGDKNLTLPRLELTGAVCAARLQNFILTNLHIQIDTCTLWSDSKITLYWINGKATKWKQYICHRVKEIQSLSVGEWRHCPGAENPADLLSRGISAKCLLESNVWQHGPAWLSKEENNWPQRNGVETPPTELTTVFLSQIAVDKKTHDFLFPLERFSDFEKTLRITAYIMRFVAKLKNPHEITFTEAITSTELIVCEKYWIKTVQSQSFKEEVICLNKNKELNSGSSILTLNPFLDEYGIMRLTGRLQDSLLPYETKHPILLPKKSPLTDFIILNSHLVTCHGGVNTTLGHVRKTYWIVQARQRIKSILNKCLSCKRLRAKPANEPFAPLPRNRLEAVSPFKITGLDFAGPLFVQTENGRIKVYIMLLTCAVIRAVHLELVPDMTTESCIRALRRFISRRGVPDVIYSDNAKTFKRASLEINELLKIISEDEVQKLAVSQRINWKFIVERAAWWGGFWERLVKSVKDALKLSLGRSTVNFDELQTTLSEVEATINSRPLTYISSDSEDLMILTPGHFLLGENHCRFDVDLNKPQLQRNAIINKWKERKAILQKFWNRWSRDYLQQLRSAHINPKIKSKSLKEGDVVLLHDQGLPRLAWKMVRVTKTFMGRDGRIRACEIRTSNGTVFRRPIQLLYPLELTVGGEDVENSAEHQRDGNAEILELS